jgi:drug/metabolite transporter (DMT)-like permease
MNPSHGRGLWLMVVATLLWSTAGVVTRHLDNAQTFEVTFWRSLFAAAAAALIFQLRQGGGGWRRIPWRSPLYWAAAVCWSVMFTAFMVGLTLTTTANVLAMLAAGPLVSALMSTWVTGHSLPARTWWAIGVASAGIFWMFGAKLALGQDQAALGMGVALLAPLAGGAQWTIAQHSRMRGLNLDLMPSVMAGALISALVTAPLALPGVATGWDITWLGILGAFQLALPCSLAVVASRVLKAAEMSLVGQLEIIFGVALAWLGAGEVPGPNVLAGGALVLLALSVNEALSLRSRQRERRTTTHTPST